MTDRLTEIAETALVPFGYAPGGYMCRCNICQQKFTGDKYADRCEPCAKKRALLAFEEPLAGQEEQHRAGAVVWLVEEVKRLRGEMRERNLADTDGWHKRLVRELQDHD